MRKSFSSKALQRLMGVVTLSMLPLLMDAQVTVNNLRYNLDYDAHTAELTFQYQESTSNYSNLEEIVVPETIMYGGETFTVTSIGPWALNRVQAYSISLPNTIVTIEKESVARVPNVKNISVPEGVTYMGHNVFMGSDIERISFPNTLREIPRGTCAEMNNLRFVSIGENVEVIGGEAFNYTNNIDTIVCRAAVPPRFDETWYGAFTSPVYSRASLFVPNLSIGAYRSADYWNEFNNIFSVELLGTPEIFVPAPPEFSSLNFIYNDYDLTAELTFEVQESSDNYSQLEKINIPEKVSRGGNTFTVTSIGPWALNRVRASEIIFPKSIRKIHKESLARIPDVDEMTIPEGVTTILDNTFMGSAIKRLYLPDSLEELAYGACAEMEDLKYVVLGKNLESIGGEGFNFTNNIDTIECRASLPPVWLRGRSVTFTDKVLESTVLLVPAEDLIRYQRHADWGKFKHIRPIETKIVEEKALPVYNGKVLVNGLYYILYPAERRATVTYELYQDSDNYSNPQTIIIPPTFIYEGIEYTVDTVGQSAFDRCYGATYISIPPTVTKIEGDGFCSNRSLEEVVIGDNVSYIGYGAFAWNYSLKTLSIGAGVKMIGGEAFNGSSELEKITCYAVEPPQFESGRSSHFDYSSYSKATLYVPYGCADKYRNADVWSEFDKIVEITTVRAEIDGIWYELDLDTLTAAVAYEILNSPDNYNKLDSLLVPSEVSYNGKSFKVVEVANHALAHSVVRNIKLPSSIVRIGIGAFVDLKSEISNVVLPASVREVANNAFAGARIKELVFNEGIVSLGFEAGARMSYLKNITLGSTLERIGDNAFMDSDNIVEVISNAVVPPAVNSYETLLFSGSVYKNAVLRVPAECLEAYRNADGWRHFVRILPIKPLPERYQVDGVWYLLDKEEMKAKVTFDVLNDKDNYKALKDAAIRASVSKDDESFEVTEIEENAFALAGNLTSVSIPASVRAIGSGAFANVESLESIIVTATTPPAIDLEDGDVFSQLTYSNATLYVPEESVYLYRRAAGWSDFYDIQPIGTVKIGSIYYKINPADHTAVTTYQVYQSSSNYQYMKAAVVPETFYWAGEEYTVVGIGESSFDRCYDLTHFDIPNTVTEIATDGFCSNHSLKHVVIGENVTKIGYGAFAYNYNLETLVIGESVETLGGEAFNYDSKLQSVTCLAQTPPVMEPGRSSTFSPLTYAYATLFVPKGLVSDYRSSSWGLFKNIKEIEEVAETVEDSNYIFNEEDKEATATYDQYNHLKNYNSLLDLILKGIIKRVVNYLPSRADEEEGYRLTVIGEHAFNHSPIRSVEFPNTLRSIERMAFANLDYLEEVEIPASVVEIGDNAFTNNTVLEKVVIGDGVKSLGYGAFAYNPSLKEVVLGKSLMSVGGEIFAGDDELESITLHAVTPPVIEEGNVAPFTLSAYRNAALFVPDESLEAYKEAEGWKLFERILPLSQSGVESVFIPSSASESYDSIGEDEIISVFTVAGAEIYKGRKAAFSPEEGLYIIVAGQKTVKVNF